MLPILESAWSEVAPKLRDRVGAQIFESWVQPLRPFAMERGVVHLEAPNRFTQEKVDSLHLRAIEEVLSDHFGTQITVQLESAPQTFRTDVPDVGPRHPIVDGSNRTAFLTLSSLLEGKELPASMFVFHGPPGVGKSFLLKWWKGAKRRKMWFDGPHLIKVFQAALIEKRLPGLREELCQPRPLVLDELHRVRGHRRLQQELVHVLEQRRNAVDPTLIAMRWHPKEVWGLDPRLEAILLSGFVSEIGEPTVKARLQFLRALEGKPSLNGRAAPIEDLARGAAGGYPEVRRAWDAQRRGGTSKYFELFDPRTLYERMRDRVASTLDVPAAEIEGAVQSRRVAQARHLVAWLCVEHGLSRAEVGRYLGRERATISTALKNLDKRLAADDELRRLAEGML